MTDEKPVVLAQYAARKATDGHRAMLPDSCEPCEVTCCKARVRKVSGIVSPSGLHRLRFARPSFCHRFIRQNPKPSFIPSGRASM
jgi:hypothetical protein